MARQREFKVGGRSAEGGEVREEAVLPRKFLFCGLEMVYFGAFWGAKVKVCNKLGDIPIDVPPTKTLEDVSGIPGGVNASVFNLQRGQARSPQNIRPCATNYCS